MRDSIVEDIKSSGIYAVLADTTPDVSHVDQISLIICYVCHEYNIKERLVEIDEIRDKTGEGFAKKVTDMLEELQLPLACVHFQCYDTTLSMSGAYNGAQAKLIQHLKRAIPYITCVGHKTNFFVEHSSKASLMIEEFFTAMQES